MCLRGQLLQLTTPYKRSVKLSRGGGLSRVPRSRCVSRHATLNCLLYADDFVLIRLISRSAADLQNQINLLHKYSEKWLLTTNLKKTKTVIFQKQNRKSTREKYLFFLNRNEISNATEYTYFGTTFYSNGNFSISKQRLVEKTRRSIFACKKYLDFNRLPISMCNKLFDSLSLYFYTAPKSGEHMTKLTLANGKKYILNFTNTTWA